MPNPEGKNMEAKRLELNSATEDQGYFADLIRGSSFELPSVFGPRPSDFSSAGANCAITDPRSSASLLPDVRSIQPV